MPQFSGGDLVFAKTGNQPHWPAKILCINADGKSQTFLYGLLITANVKPENVETISEKSRELYAKARRRNSKLADVFAAAMVEIDSNPSLGDNLVAIAAESSAATAANSQLRRPFTRSQQEVARVETSHSPDDNVLPFELLI